ncbi:DNA polymerase III subunit alpha [Arthrobacter sp. STN4]|uniref:DNA polymerase III subunit alpha n=1 Tax=Arthrobacter sp. STN4 TaxID=2923276 RepID=UPI00211AA099|nr:DNA polymerase III subunit alpha [Arthrobacter sp. STN4]MCQ9163835.1 DNA polymerase III subunit alpha [Arthrobacter sp. STN4]
MPKFVHLHAASAYSAHYGVSWPDDLVQAAAADGADALAATDRDGLYGAIKHVQACMAAGIDPILGVDLAILDDAGQGSGAGPSRSRPAPVETGRVVVLAHGGRALRAGAGYAALCRLVSAAHARQQGPVGLTLAELAGGVLDPETGEPALTVLVGPFSDVAGAMGGRRYLAPRTRFAAWLHAMPAGTLAVEVVSHFSEPGGPLSTTRAVRMLKLAEEFGVPAVLANAVRYCTADDAPTADVLDAARAITPLGRLPGLQPTGQGWLKSGADMHRAGREIVGQGGYGTAELEQLWANTLKVADKCRLDPAADLGWKRPVTPEAAVLGLSQAPARELWQRAEAGLSLRFPGIGGGRLAAVRDRLTMEMDTINDLGFASYFLTVAEVSEMIRGMGVRRAARGSGASSLVNYLLGISAVDPIANDLLFERFLSRDRSTLPDIDLDVESAERHNVYHRIFERFGPRRVTLMSMQNGYRARGAVRDAGLALGMDPEDVDGIAKQLWRFSARSFREALVEKPELRDFAARVEQAHELGGGTQLDLLVDLTERLDRLPRHISMHPCGVILGDATLLDRTPVQPSGLGLPMSQFDKHDMDPMGMLKLDVLGVRMQSAMAYAVREVVRLHPSKAEVVAAGRHPAGPDGRGPDYVGEDGRIDLDAVPLDDEPTFELIRSTHTLGCFQIESPGQRELVGKMAPREFNDLIIDISLFRPGPMKSNMVKPYLENRHGFAPEHYAHPDLKPALAETHGVTVFHEQVLRTFHVMTGCSLSHADEHRRRLGNPEQEPAVEAFFRTSARAKGYGPETIEEVWETLKAFGSFGFCKAHGAAFAMPTYQSAWLKAHHPAEFLAGLWEHDPGMYPRRLLVAEARRMGIPILPLDVNASTGSYRAERTRAVPGGSGGNSGGATGGREAAGREAAGEEVTGIRLSLADVYGLSGTELKRIVAGQPYDSLADLRSRARVSRPVLKRLAQLGALDSLQRSAQQATGNTANRADLVAHVNSLPAPKSGRHNEPMEGQLHLPLGELELGTLPARLPAPTQAETVRTELDLLALDASAHLMDSYAPLLAELGVTTSDRLLGLRNNSEVLVAGVRVATQTPPMRGGRRVVFISIDDGTGCVDATFFHEAQDRSGPLLFGTRMLLIRGLTRRTGPRGISLQALEAWDLGRPETLPGPGCLQDPRRPQDSRHPAPGKPEPTVAGLARLMESEGLDHRTGQAAPEGACPAGLVGAARNRYDQGGPQQPPYVAWTRGHT